MSTQTDLAELYTTFFNRAPDAGGLTYWTDAITTGQLTLAQIAENWTTQQPEGQAAFPVTLTDAQFVEKVYGNILGRTSDADGAQYWLDQLGNGTLSRDAFALTLINGAKANTSAQGVLDNTLITNKATVGVAYADKGLNDTTLGAKVLSSVSTDAASVSGTLAILSLIPSATAGQTAAVLASANQLLTNLATLITTAPGEVADASTYLQTLASGATSSTNLVTLLDNASTLLTSAASNPAALDNPAVQGSAAVVVATPGTGGGGTPTPTFTVTEDINGVLTFGGTATGDVTFTVTNGDATFLRGGVSATPAIDVSTITDTGGATVKLAANATGLSFADATKLTSLTNVDLNNKTLSLTGVQASDVASALALTGVIAVAAAPGDAATALTLNAESLAKVSGFTNITLADTSATINTNLLALLSNTNVVAIDSTENTTAINLTAAQGILTANTDKLAAGDQITVVDTSANINSNLTALFANAKIDSIDSSQNTTALNLTAAQGILTANTDKLAAGDQITVLDTSANINNNLTALFANAKIDSIDSNENTTAINLTAAQGILTANTDKLAAGDQITVVDTSANINNNLTALFANAKIDSIDSNENTTAINLTAAQGILTANTDKLAAGDQITVVDTSANINSNLTALFANAKIDSIDSSENTTAINLTAGQGILTANTDKLAAGDQITVVDTSANINSNLTALFADAKIDSINSSEDTVAIGLTTAQATNANLLKLSADDRVTLNAAGGDSFSFLTNVDRVNTGASNVTGAASTSAAAVDGTAGNQWFFAADVGGDSTADELTFYNTATSSAQKIVLSGVTSVSLDSAGVFNLTPEVV
ncbi:DUF4214 domain-containing protein [Pseudomonas syringae]|uniref:DUF4214 domain-containing protein n=1 Tax=Pseudomonas syringae CC1417 TaxID=1357272 RepID=A0AAU8L8Z1_PSESX